MGSLYKDVDLFGSGPHRFVNGKVGRRIVSLAALSGDISVEGTIESGDYEVRVEVHGRLIADDDEGLWLLRDAIIAESHSSVGSGILIDHHGHEWSGFKLISFEELGGVSRGRRVSVRYVVEFGALATG